MRNISAQDFPRLRGDLLGTQRVAALVTAQYRSGFPSTEAVAVMLRWAIPVVEPVVTPLAQRHEYRLTRKGLALYPVLMTLSQWGDDWMDDGNGPPQRYRHSLCGKQTRAVLSCDECGDPLRPEEVSVQAGEVLSAYVAHLNAQGEPLPSEGELAREAAQYWRENRSEQA